MNEIAEHFSSYYLAKLHRCAWLRAGAKLHIPSAMNIQMNLTILLFGADWAIRLTLKFFEIRRIFFSYFHGKTNVKLQFL